MPRPLEYENIDHPDIQVYGPPSVSFDTRAFRNMVYNSPTSTCFRWWQAMKSPAVSTLREGYNTDGKYVRTEIIEATPRPPRQRRRINITDISTNRRMIESVGDYISGDAMICWMPDDAQIDENDLIEPTGLRHDYSGIPPLIENEVMTCYSGEKSVMDALGDKVTASVSTSGLNSVLTFGSTPYPAVRIGSVLEVSGYFFRVTAIASVVSCEARALQSGTPSSIAGYTSERWDQAKRDSACSVIATSPVSVPGDWRVHPTEKGFEYIGSDPWHRPGEKFSMKYGYRARYIVKNSSITGIVPVSSGLTPKIAHVRLWLPESVK